jgi:hypothetical protein
MHLKNNAELSGSVSFHYVTSTTRVSSRIPLGPRERFVYVPVFDFNQYRVITINMRSDRVDQCSSVDESRVLDGVVN